MKTEKAKCKLDKMTVSSCVLQMLFLHQAIGMQLLFNRASIDLGTTADLDFVMTCRMDGVREFDSLITLQIKRLKEDSSGAYETLAILRDADGVNEPAFADPKPEDLATKEATVGGNYNAYNPRASTLTLTFKISRMVCSDGRQYVCEAYIVLDDTNGNVDTERQQASKNLTVNAFPLTPITMTAKNLTSGFDIPNQGFAPTNIASFMQDQMVQLTCTGSIGSNGNAVFSWRKTDRYGVATPFNPSLANKDDGTAGNFMNCQYQRSAWVRYNMTSADATRDSNINPLQFECYIQSGSYFTPEADRPKFYIHVDKESSDIHQGGGVTEGNDTSSSASNARFIILLAVLPVAVLAIAC